MSAGNDQDELPSTRDVLLDADEFDSIPLTRDHIAGALAALAPLNRAMHRAALATFDDVKHALKNADAKLIRLQVRAARRS